MRRLLPSAVVLFVALGAAACGSDDAVRGGGRFGGPGAAGRRVPATLDTFPAETQTFMKTALRQFSAQDPTWQSTRREWLALGARESDFLVQLIWGALLAGQARNAPDIVERSRSELALIGAPSIPLMAEVLSTGTLAMTDPATGEEVEVTIDDLQRREAAEVLALVGPVAVPAVIDALERAGTKGGRRAAVQALGSMGDRGGPGAVAALVACSADPDVTIAVESVYGMRNYHDAETRAALLRALAGPEPLVREKAADSLAGRLDASAIPALADAAARARADGRLAEAARIERAARALQRSADR